MALNVRDVAQKRQRDVCGKHRRLLPFWGDKPGRHNDLFVDLESDPKLGRARVVETVLGEDLFGWGINT
jgi:hypothetical protein